MAITNVEGQGFGGGNQLLTSEQIQQAKDFIWEHIPDKTKEWFCYVIGLPESERAKYYVDKVVLQKDKIGEIFSREIVVLSFPETFQNPNKEH